MCIGFLEDIIKALDRIPIWKRLQELPSEVDTLKAKVADLEEKLNGKWPGDVCRFCGSRSARLQHTYGGQLDAKGMVRECWKCTECEQQDERSYVPSAKA